MHFLFSFIYPVHANSLNIVNGSSVFEIFSNYPKKTSTQLLMKTYIGTEVSILRCERTRTWVDDTVVKLGHSESESVVNATNDAAIVA